MKQAKPIVIFGTGNIAELAHYYFSHDSERNVAAFTVDRAYCKSEILYGLPLVPFEELEERYPPKQYDMFISVGYSQSNQLRRAKYLQAKEKGYELASYISSLAIFSPTTSSIGDNCFILEQNNIQPFVHIGNNVTLWSGNHIGHHSKIDDHCFVASHCVISGECHIGEACFLGVNATIRDHVTIANGCIIGAGALIMHDTKENETYKGIPSASIQTDREI